MKKYKYLTALFMGSMLALSVGITANANVKTYNQKGAALIGGTAKTFVNNKSYARIPNYSYGAGNDYYASHTYQTKPEFYQANGGNFRRNAKTKYFLPVTHKVSGDMSNPQSVAQTPDGHYAYVMYSAIDGGQSNIVRFDLNKLKALGVDTTHMDELRRGLNSNPQTQSAVKFGPKFNTGHAQSLAYNYKTGQLWFVRMAVATHKPTLVQVSRATLTPTKQIHFKFSSHYQINNELAFDKHGNVYTYVKYLGNKHSAGSIAIFKGTIKGNKVKFKAIKQGIKNGPGQHTQGMSYNPKSNRLYFISDGEITSVPVNKLGHLKNHDVRTTRFNTNREFEGLSFTNNGKGLILINRGAELLEIDNF
ncbi:hypothetical protein [Apilactobacillus micheneri]|uniref:hypothetical protein n=1 Tax=Apilactobacillus micheneri TaxID=1899430 RepID=UPI00112B9A50|nr:hypothetical protein [Apilactobacillus micheneri]TPR50971.1 hypothetical protein DY126_06470 [Apilactobacillus micheneri]